MFDHSIRTLKESIRFFAGLGFEEGVEAKDLAHAIAVLKAAGEMDKRECLLWISRIEPLPVAHYSEGAGQIRRLIESLPEVKDV